MWNPMVAFSHTFFFGFWLQGRGDMDAGRLSYMLIGNIFKYCNSVVGITSMAVSSATMAFGRRTSYNGVWDRKNITKKWPILIASSFTMLFKENSTAELDMQSEKWPLLIAKTLTEKNDQFWYIPGSPFYSTTNTGWSKNPTWTFLWQNFKLNSSGIMSPSQGLAQGVCEGGFISFFIPATSRS